MISVVHPKQILFQIITYLLGVGDRHQDNLLLTSTGKLFHIDFGYILGRDPKPMPPPMKLSKEMVEAMGGLNRKLCYTAFLRHANVMLNLFGLMVDASIPDIALEPDKAVKKLENDQNSYGNYVNMGSVVSGTVNEPLFSSFD